MAQATRDRIVTTAVELFNASSAGVVSTNHIAEALGISPGNLYYHFRNKEEIIRAIYERMGGEWDVIFALPPDRLPTLADLEAMELANYQTLWKYRFFYRELGALMRRDPILHESYLARRLQGLADLVLLIQSFGAVGVLRLPDDPAVTTELADILWIIADFWLPYIELDGQTLTPATLQQGISLFQRALQPYLIEHPL